MTGTTFAAFSPSAPFEGDIWTDGCSAWIFVSQAWLSLFSSDDIIQELNKKAW